MSKKLNIIGQVWGDSYDLILKKPRLLFPLCIVAFLEALWLELFYFAPRPPLNAFLLPPIKRFFGEAGEAAVHYPAYLFFLPKLFGYGQLLLYILIGGILTSVTMVMAVSESENHPLRFSAAFKKVRHRLFALILVSFSTTALLGIVTGREIAFFKMGFGFVGKGPLLQLLRLLTRLLAFLNFFIAIAVQTFVAFIFPFIVLGNQKFFPAIGKSFALGSQQFRRVYLLLLLPMVCYGPLWMLKMKPAFLIRMTLYPELLVWLLGVGIIATVLVDTFVAVAIALFFQRVRHEKSA